MVSAKDLRKEVDNLDAVAPHLRPTIVPRGVETEISMLARMEGPATEMAIQEQLEVANRKRFQSCSVCGAPGHFQSQNAGKRPGGTTDDDNLRFEPKIQIDFVSRRIRYQQGLFCCRLCCSALRMHNLVQLAVNRMTVPQCSDEWTSLCWHILRVNKAPPAIMNSPDAAAAWMHGLFARSYALRVAASNVGGWSLSAPDDTTVKAGTSGEAERLLQLMLVKSTKGAPKRPPSEGTQPGSEGKRRKRDRPRVLEDANELQRTLDDAERRTQQAQASEKKPERAAANGVSRTTEGKKPRSRTQPKGRSDNARQIAPTEAHEGGEKAQAEDCAGNGIADGEILNCRFLDDLDYADVPLKRRKDRRVVSDGHVPLVLSPKLLQSQRQGSQGAGSEKKRKRKGNGVGTDG